MTVDHLRRIWNRNDLILFSAFACLSSDQSFLRIARFGRSSSGCFSRLDISSFSLAIETRNFSKDL